MMISLNLQDSDINGKKTTTYQESSACIRAIDVLSKLFEEGKVTIFNLLKYRPCETFEMPIKYQIETNTTMHGYPMVDVCRYFTSHYVGSFSAENVKVSITPRFVAVFNYMVGYTTNLYIPISAAEYGRSTCNSAWLIAFIWKAMLNKALTKSQIPKSYIQNTKNLKHFRGRLDLHRHIHANLTNASRSFCTYPKLSIDNTINRTICYTLTLFRRKKVGHILKEFDEYSRKLESFGVTLTPVRSEEIDSIKYNRLNADYSDVMQLSKLIIQNYGAESISSNLHTEFSYFIDIAELWEAYLLKLLQRNLHNYHVFSPNTSLGDYLLENNMREIRPDIIIEREGRVLMVIDAKYKSYRRFGKKAVEGVQREDLYQMSSYLYHYGKEPESIVGVFSAPVKSEDSCLFSFSSNRLHRIGLVNLEIEEKQDNEQIRQAEKLYIEKIIDILKSIQ